MEESSKREIENDEDPFSPMMLESKRQMDEMTQKPMTTSNFDVTELMIYIDTFMESLNNLKPIIQKAFPYIQQLWKKTKEDD